MKISYNNGYYMAISNKKTYKEKIKNKIRNKK